MSRSFEERLYRNLPAIARRFGTPFHIYDANGIRETSASLKDAFKGVPGFNEFYAVKANPNPAILGLMYEQGFGFDCSSPLEIRLAVEAGADLEQIMFTSNNTTPAQFKRALDADAIINLDDISLVDKVPGRFPKLISFRYNPGKKRAGNSIIGKPHEAKFGITDEQLIPAYRAAMARGAKRFGIHTMVCSNELDYHYMVDTVVMLLELCERLERKLGIRCEFMNIGGGLGIPYRPDQRPFNIKALGKETAELVEAFRQKYRWAPQVFTESGRFMTGPHGVLVNRVINHKHIYQTYVGVEIGMHGLMRPAIYGAYHHVTVVDSRGRSCANRRRKRVTVVGATCENCDYLAKQRLLPETREGDFLITQDTGAHGIAMASNYNGWPQPQELLMVDNCVYRIRRGQTEDDLLITHEGFSPDNLELLRD